MLYDILEELGVPTEQVEYVCRGEPGPDGLQDHIVIHLRVPTSETVGGTTPDTHSRPHGLRSQGWPSPQDEALWGTTLLDASRKTPGRYPEDTTRSVRICMILRFL